MTLEQIMMIDKELSDLTCKVGESMSYLGSNWTITSVNDEFTFIKGGEHDSERMIPSLRSPFGLTSMLILTFFNISDLRSNLLCTIFAL